MGIDPDAIMALAMWMFVPGILGARLFYIVQYWEEFDRPTMQETLLSLLNFTSGGLVMTVVATGATLAGARGRALINAERITFEGRTFRTDIAAKEFG